MNDDRPPPCPIRQHDPHVVPGRERALLALGLLPERAPLFWTQPRVSHPQLRRIGEDAPQAPTDLADDSLAAVFDRLAESAATR